MFVLEKGEKWEADKQIIAEDYKNNSGISER